jgi:tetratricopeptide (TPR) repeat protein
VSKACWPLTRLTHFFQRFIPLDLQPTSAHDVLRLAWERGSQVHRGLSLPDGRVANAAPCSNIESVRARAELLQHSKNFDDAAQLWQQFIAQDPENAEAINELGTVLLSAGRFEQALQRFQQALEISPSLSTRTNIGVALRHLNRLEEAISCFKQIIAIAPDDAIACFHLGTTLHLSGKPDEALTWLRRACDLCPSHAESALELGKLLQVLKRKDEAIREYQRAASLKPDCLEALLSLGGLLQEVKQFEAASEAFQKVVDLDPKHCNAWLDLGGALLGVRRHAESLVAFRRALAIQPGSAVGYCNMAIALANLGRIEEAIDACRKALCIEPGSPVASFNMGTLLLKLGDFRQGWQAYNYRFAMHGEKWLREEAHAAPWTGEALTGKSILVLGEQANGDHIQFSRYLPALADLGACVSYLAPKRLHRLFRTLGDSITLLDEIPENSRYDFQCPLLNVPGVFENLGLPIPTKTPYLAAEPNRVAQWKSRIGDHGFRVGIVWRGNKYDGNDVRSYPLAALRPLSAISGIRLISLQINDGTEQLTTVPPALRVERLDSDFDSGEHGFLDTAAVMEVLDLIICCDTSIAHLAGALARPVWIALGDRPEWRWQQQREDSLWYSTARLFRQEAGDDWDGVFSRMSGALIELLKTEATSLPESANPPNFFSPRVGVSWGELLDKISILEIKAKRMTSSAAIANVRRELEHLSAVLAGVAPLPLQVEKEHSTLRTTNEHLWELEDAVRACEADQRFDAQFIDAARKIYAFNDRRAKIKQQINILMKSTFIEEKEHSRAAEQPARKRSGS